MRFFVSYLLWLICANLAQGQETAQDILPADRATILQVSKYVSRTPPVLDGVLGQIGFDPSKHAGVTRDQFSQWPDVRKLEAAYRAAQAGSGENGGGMLLRGVARQLAATRANSIRYESSLRSYFPEPLDTALPSEEIRIVFERVGAPKPAPVPDGVRRVVSTLARYVSPAPGGLPSLMAACCALSDADAYNLLSRAETNAAALSEALSNSRIPPELRERLERAVKHVLERNSSFREEAIVRAANTGQPARTRSTTDGAEIQRLARNVAERAMGSQLPLTTPVEAERTLNKDKFLARTNEVRTARSAPSLMSPRAEALGFNEVTKLPRGGFGGIVFGNDLSMPQGFAVARVAWIPLAEYQGREHGRFEFVSTGGQLGYSAVLPTDIAFAARQIAYERVDGVLPAFDPTTRDAAPLAGYLRFARVPHIVRFDEVAQALTTNELSGYVVNPLIDGLPLAYSAVVADAMPRHSGDIMERLETAGASQRELEHATAWIEHARHSGYKIMDAPLQIRVEPDGYVDVLSVPTGDFPMVDRSTALLLLQMFEEDRPVDPFAEGFYETLPRLMQVSPEFAELNVFAEAFALVRWAKVNNAVWTALPATAPRNRPLHFVELEIYPLALCDPDMSWEALGSAVASAATLADPEFVGVSKEIAVLQEAAIVDAAASQYLGRIPFPIASEDVARDNAVAQLEVKIATAVQHITTSLEQIEDAMYRDLRSLLTKQYEASFSLSDAELELEGLDSVEHRSTLASGSVLTKATELISERDRLFVTEFESDQELSAFWRRLEAIDQELDTLLPRDTAAVTALQSRITALEAEQKSIGNDIDAISSSARFVRYQNWRSLQQDIVRALGVVGTGAPVLSDDSAVPVAQR